MTNIHPGASGIESGFVPVTVVGAGRRLDVALPTTVPWADLQPGLLRLLLADQRVDPGRWLLTPVGRNDIDPSQTLSDAGILTGDVLLVHQVLRLDQRTGSRPAAPGTDSVRDRVEDLVDRRQRYWGPGEARRLALWTAAAAGAGLLAPAALLVAGPVTVPGVPQLAGPELPPLAGAGLAATVAVIVALIAVLAARSAEAACAAVGLCVACGWAALAGALVVRGALAHSASAAGASGTVGGSGAVGAVGTAGQGPTGQALLAVMLVAGAASALLLAGCCVAGYPGALVHAAALLVVVAVAATVAVPVSRGGSMIDLGAIVALSAVLLIGVTPRVALAVSGVGGAARRQADLDGRIVLADRLLTGAVLGLSLVAVAGALSAALSADGWHRLFALGVGLLLMLRSRMFSQVPHVLSARIGALLVFAELCGGLAIGEPLLLVPVILGPVVGLALVAARLTLVTAASPVGLARAGRAMDLAELALVALLIVLLAGLLGLSGWVTAVVG